MLIYLQVFILVQTVLLPILLLAALSLRRENKIRRDQLDEFMEISGIIIVAKGQGRRRR